MSLILNIVGILVTILLTGYVAILKWTVNRWEKEHETAKADISGLKTELAVARALFGAADAAVHEKAMGVERAVVEKTAAMQATIAGVASDVRLLSLKFDRYIDRDRATHHDRGDRDNV